MIEQLLLRVAKRGNPLETRVSSEPDSSSFSIRSTPSLPFPAKRQGKLANRVVGQDNLAAWKEACADLHDQARPFPPASALPPAFAEYSAVDAHVASLMYSERHRIGARTVHLVGKTGRVVAAIYPREREVLVRQLASESEAKLLSWRELPATAGAFDASVQQQFRSSTAYMLLWFYGQVSADALELVPHELISGAMLLRKLPLIDPRALDLRHLKLIHIFSAGSLTFQEVLSLLEPEATKYIGSDIASLYLTGCLVSADS